MTKNISEKFRGYYAIAVTLIFFLSMVALFILEIPEKNRAIIDMCIGALVRDFISIITFYFKEDGAKEESMG